MHSLPNYVAKGEPKQMPSARLCKIGNMMKTGAAICKAVPRKARNSSRQRPSVDRRKRDLLYHGQDDPRYQQGQHRRLRTSSAKGPHPDMTGGRRDVRLARVDSIGQRNTS